MDKYFLIFLCIFYIKDIRFSIKLDGINILPENEKNEQKQWLDDFIIPLFFTVDYNTFTVNYNILIVDDYNYLVKLATVELKTENLEKILKKFKNVYDTIIKDKEFIKDIYNYDYIENMTESEEEEENIIKFEKIYKESDNEKIYKESDNEKINWWEIADTNTVTNTDTNTITNAATNAATNTVTNVVTNVDNIAGDTNAKDIESLKSKIKKNKHSMIPKRIPKRIPKIIPKIITMIICYYFIIY